MSSIADITKLYEDKYDDLVRAYRSRAGVNDVEDLVQEAFYRAIKFKDSYNPKLVDLEFWFVGILNNCLKDLFGEKQGRATMHKEFLEETSIEEYTEPERIDYRHLLSLIEQKSGDAKQICYLYFIMHYKLSDITKIIGCSYSNVNNIVDNFKNKLKEHYR